MLRNLVLRFFLLSLLLLDGMQAYAAIDREALVGRHKVVIHQTLPESPAQVGNGHFAFGMDITGLQTFRPFNTLSDWSWHSMPLPEGKTVDDYRPVGFESHGRMIPYKLPNPDEEEISSWMRCNPHRYNLARIGFVLLRRDGSISEESDLANAEQLVDLWTGEVSSSFELEGSRVAVSTVCDPSIDVLAVKVESDLISSGRLKFFLDFPYPDLRWISKKVGDYDLPSRHITRSYYPSENVVWINHIMDDTAYGVGIRSDVRIGISRDCDTLHRYTLTPDSSNKTLSLTFTFSEGGGAVSTSSFEDIRTSYAAFWRNYWMNGAVIDFSGSTDPRAFELERRVVLSQFLMRLNESGYFPPQESGLVNNGWYGRFHWEMIWWHAAHWFLWDRRYCASYLDIYSKYLPSSIKRAEEEGRSGARWPKCTGNINREWPCDTHAWLIWQQPHPIWFAEAEYRMDPSPTCLRKWEDVVLNTADYMADYLFKEGRNYVIGPPVAAVSENTRPVETRNPIFELAYFRYGFKTALIWAERLGLPASRTAKWRKALKHLSPLPQEDGYYITCEGMDDMWHNYNFEHPALTGVYGWLPGDGVDKEVFRRTFYRVLSDWQMDKIWGWDYPMLAMAAARLGDSAKAVDLLTATAHKFGFDAHGLATTWPFPYFPANGGLLTAVAMMAAGWDGSSGQAPGFPQDGSWKIEYEGFVTMQ